MKIELRELMRDNNMLSHIFLDCIPREKLMEIKDKYVGETDWEKLSKKLGRSLERTKVDAELLHSLEGGMDPIIKL